MCPYYLDGDQTGDGNVPGLVITRSQHFVGNVANCAVFKVRRGAPPRGTPTGGLSKLNSACAARSLERTAFRPSPVDMLGGPASAIGRADTLCIELPRKEVIQPHLPVRLPCYDFTPITSPTFDGCLP